MKMNILEYMEFVEIPLYLYLDLDKQSKKEVVDVFFYRIRYLVEKKESKEILLDALQKYNERKAHKTHKT